MYSLSLLKLVLENTIFLNEDREKEVIS